MPIFTSLRFSAKGAFSMQTWGIGIAPGPQHTTNISAIGAAQRPHFNQRFPRASPGWLLTPCDSRFWCYGWAVQVRLRFSHLDKNDAFRLKFPCRPSQVHLLDSQFLRLFWGEQPPFAPFRAWGAVLPSDDGTAILFPTLQLALGLHSSWANCNRSRGFRV